MCSVNGLDHCLTQIIFKKRFFFFLLLLLYHWAKLPSLPFVFPLVPFIPSTLKTQSFLIHLSFTHYLPKNEQILLSEVQVRNRPDIPGHPSLTITCWLISQLLSTVPILPSLPSTNGSFAHLAYFPKSL